MKTTLNVFGMTCNNCLRHVTEALEKINGVKKVNVSLENKNATIEHADNISEHDLIAAIKEAGYKTE